MDEEILDLIRRYKEGDNKSLMLLIDRFKPLIKKYTKLLYYTDVDLYLNPGQF